MPGKKPSKARPKSAEERVKGRIAERTRRRWAKGFGVVMNRDLSDYRHKFYFRDEKFGSNRFRACLEELAQSKQPSVDVLDLGAGQGIALAEIKRAIEGGGKKVNAEAVVLGKAEGFGNPRLSGQGSPPKKRPEIKFHETPAELFKPGKQYDLIVSFYGAVSYSEHPLLLLRGMMRSLKPGGHIFLFDLLRPETLEKLEALAKREGKNIKLQKEYSGSRDFEYRVLIHCPAP